MKHAVSFFFVLVTIWADFIGKDVVAYAIKHFNFIPFTHTITVENFLNEC